MSANETNVQQIVCNNDDATSGEACEMIRVCISVSIILLNSSITLSLQHKLVEVNDKLLD
jgi:hypothetical protein